MDTRPQTIAELYERMEQRFDQVERKFEKVELRFEHIDRQFEHVEQRFEQVDRRFEHINQQVEQRFAHVNDLLDTIAMATNAHSTKVDDLTGSRDNHELRIEHLERSVARLKIKLVH
ncbi:MAG: hypothetical protein NUV56_02140 [Candidatus Uhrbacteria bacterium]|nr:hypothetical protein [Candidatus Uhrbacteria bacterium]